MAGCHPRRSDCYYGQINLVLMALVMVDCLTPRPRWPRGVLVGMAAAIKLTPAGFVLFFLLRKDFRAAVTAGAAFGVTTAVGFLLAGAASVKYWSGELFATGRIGRPQYAGNQSLLGALARFGIEPPLRTVAWGIGVAVVLWLAVRAMRKAAGNPRLALVFNALAVLVISPVSWSHHWVWILPMLVVLPYGPLVAAVFVAAPQWWWPGTENTEYTWNLAQQLLGNSYLWFAILILAAGSRLAAVIAPCAAPSVIRTAQAGP
jgi:alpha-1,2-mannosyltransferase